MAGNYEKTWGGTPEKTPEESGIRRVSKQGENSLQHNIAGLTPEETNRAIAAKSAEEHPDDPWEEFGPKDEPNTAKVWGVTEDLDAEDREHAKRLAARLSDFDEGSEKKSA
jgi:hypothetical protein